jgi:hypothetical protein
LALVKVSLPSDAYGLNAVQGIFGAIYTGIEIATERPKEGTFVSMQSPKNGAEFGHVLYPDADVTGPTGRKETHVCLADYPSEPSDSGAPVLSHPQSGATCYGFHGGRVVVQGKNLAFFVPLDNIELDDD